MIFIFKKHLATTYLFFWDSFCTGSGEQEGTPVQLTDCGNSPEERFWWLGLQRVVVETEVEVFRTLLEVKSAGFNKGLDVTINEGRRELNVDS